MPELPEVQTIVNDLKREIVGRRILSVWVDWPRHIKYPSLKEFKRNIRGAKILGVTRRAKNIIILLDKDRILLIHPKMTGHLLVAGKIKNKHIHLIFHLDKGVTLAFSDVRKFGKVLFGKTQEVFKLPDLKDIGPEPLGKNFSFGDFKRVVSKHRRKIKEVLMDQKVIAGIGNIYSDEILWLSKIHPAKPANKLTDKELRNIYSRMRLILKRAISLRGASVSDFRDTSGKEGRYAGRLMIYGKVGKPCRRCGTAIKRIKINNRSAHYCPRCQKA